MAHSGTLRPYRPSNGTEGDIFMAEWCEKCALANFDDDGAGAQPLAFFGNGVGMRLTDATNDLWEVYDWNGNILASDLVMEAADAMGSRTASSGRQANETGSNTFCDVSGNHGPAPDAKAAGPQGYAAVVPDSGCAGVCRHWMGRGKQGIRQGAARC